MKKNQTGEAQCCWKARTSVSWSACQPSAHEVLGLIRLMHLLMGLTRLFNESVISFTRSVSIDWQGPHCTKGKRGQVGISSSSSGSKAEDTKNTGKRVSETRHFLGYGNGSSTTIHILVVESILKITLWGTVSGPRQQIRARSVLLQNASESSGGKIAVNDIILPTRLPMFRRPLAFFTLPHGCPFCVLKLPHSLLPRSFRRCSSVSVTYCCQTNYPKVQGLNMAAICWTHDCGQPAVLPGWAGVAVLSHVYWVSGICWQVSWWLYNLGWLPPVSGN